MEAGWSARRVTRQVCRSDLTVRYWDQWTKETPFTRANCLFGRCPDTGSSFTAFPCVFPNHRKVPGRRISDIAVSIMCAANDTHPPTPSFGVVSRMTRLDCNEMEPGHLQSTPPLPSFLILPVLVREGFSLTYLTLFLCLMDPPCPGLVTDSHKERE
ncbi:hypothetical protein TNCV_125101 [Trichonephila clavipes]|nr:hypothetical protein TNCV_125101 [Trichonephila clavipes]